MWCKVWNYSYKTGRRYRGDRSSIGKRLKSSRVSQWARRNVSQLSRSFWYMLQRLSVNDGRGFRYPMGYMIGEAGIWKSSQVSWRWNNMAHGGGEGSGISNAHTRGDLHLIANIAPALVCHLRLDISLDARSMELDTTKDGNLSFKAVNRKQNLRGWWTSCSCAQPCLLGGLTPHTQSELNLLPFTRENFPIMMHRTFVEKSQINQFFRTNLLKLASLCEAWLP